MKLFAVAAVLGLATPVFSYTEEYIAAYDTFYDHGEKSLGKTSCAHGEHGLLTHGYTTFDDLPTFPYIGGSPMILSSDSRYCGTCWELTYTDPSGVSTGLNFTAMDIGGDDSEIFIISLEALDFLTQGHGRILDHIPITVARKPKSACGL